MSEVGTFSDRWADVSPTLLRHCDRLRRDEGDGEDLLQQVAIRAWRGYPTFRGDCSFLTWVMRIAERESMRMHARDQRRLDVEIRAALDRERVEPTRRTDDEIRPEIRASDLLSAIDRAERGGWLRSTEGAVLRARIASPHTVWKEIGPALGLTGPACAVVHCRAVPRLRVYLVRHEPTVLGGRDAVLAAFAEVSDDPSGALTDAERAAFRAVVLDGRADLRVRGWQRHLQRACAVVVGRMEVTIR
jgi:RNA polymerase sigma factor (sigma-70 family)